MKNSIVVLIVAIFASTVSAVPVVRPKPGEKPADEAKAPSVAAANQDENTVPVEVTGMLVKDGEQLKLMADGKKYLVTKNNADKVAAYVGKNVKITGKAKTNPGEGGKQFHMLVFVGSISEAAAPATTVATAPAPAAPAAPAPEVGAEPVAAELTGSLVKEGEQIKLLAGGKKYLVTKNNHGLVTAYVGKTVKLTCKVKTNMGDGGKPFTMVVFVNKVTEVPAAP